MVETTFKSFLTTLTTTSPATIYKPILTSSTTLKTTANDILTTETPGSPTTSPYRFIPCQTTQGTPYNFDNIITESPLSILTTQNLNENTSDNQQVWRYLYGGLGIILGLVFIYYITKLKEKNIVIEAMRYYNLYWLVFGILIVLSLMLWLNMFKGFVVYLWIGYVTFLIVTISVVVCWFVETRVLCRQVPPVSYQ